MILENKIFTISSPEDFKTVALEVFQFQYNHITVYQEFCDLLNVNPSKVNALEDIPFLPIQFFKSHQVVVENSIYDTVFTSSGTTGSITSKHFVLDLNLYKKSFSKIFYYYFCHLISPIN